MTQPLSWVRDGEKLLLSGELDQDFLNPLWEARDQAMQGVTCIDLHAISRVDTAGVALLAHLVAAGKKQGLQVSLAGASDNVITLAQLYNLPQDVLPRYLFQYVPIDSLDSFMVGAFCLFKTAPLCSKMLGLFSLTDYMNPWKIMKSRQC
jgi:phospholipid transport system transporter-binding protein